MSRLRLRASVGLVLIVLIVVVVARRTTSLEAAVSACRAADTIIVPVRLVYLKDFMSSSDPEYSLARDSVGLASQSAAKVKLVTKSTVCQDGVNALNILLETPGAVREIWLFALGNGYAIHDPSIPPVPGEPAPLYIFNSQFSYKSTLMVF